MLDHLNPSIKNPNKIFVGEHLNLGAAPKMTVYTVKRGDSLHEIAKKYQTTVGDILRANPRQVAKPNLIFPGQKLNIPVQTQPKITTQNPKQSPTRQAPVVKQHPPIQEPVTKPQAPKLPTQPSNTTPNPVLQAPNTIANSNGELRLGANEKYRDDLIFAEKLTGTSASSLAGVINAEAAQKNGVWQADSYNKKTNAGGLTQFLPATWREMATTRGTYLNKIAVEKGYVKEVSGKFQVIDDAKLQDLRFNSRTAIVTAAQYDQKTLAQADRLGLVPQNLSSDEKAKYLYYAHHEGPGGVLTHLVSSKTATEEQAKSILTIRLGGKDKAEAYVQQHGGSYREAYSAFAEQKARNNFPAQFGDDKSVMNNYVKKYGGYEDGYRAWLTDYTDKKVRPQDFRQNGATTTVPQQTTQTTQSTQQTPKTQGTNNVKQSAMPDTHNLSEDQKFDIYADFVSQNGNAKAKSDLADGQRVILGLRQPTNSRVNNGNGAYDDRIVVLWKDKDGKKHVKEITNANTEPASHYEDTEANRADPKRRNKITKTDANGDGRGDLGRLTTGTHEYKKSYAKGFGIEQETGFNILRPTSSNKVERDSNHDGNFDGKDISQNKRGTTDGGTMYFHRGGRGGFTGSAGYQTMPQSDFNEFYKSLGDQKTFQYVLVEVK